MNYPDKDNRLNEIIEEIQYIQNLPYQNWISALARKVKVTNLHAELDEMGYAGERPPRSWSHLNAGKPKPN